MAESILQVMKNAFSDKAVDSISRNVGEDGSKTRTGLNVMIPTVLAGILGKSANQTTAPSWWNSVANLFDGNNDDDLRLDLVGDNRLADTGKGLLGSLFGGNLDTILGALSRATGMSIEKSGKMLTMVAPMVIGYLSRWAKKKGLSYASLMSSLRTEQSAIVAALPAGIGAGMLGLTEKPRQTHDEPPKRVVEEKPTPSKFNWTWLLLLLGLLILLWLLFGRGCNRDNDEIDDQTTEVTSDMDRTGSGMTQSVGGALNDAGDWVYDLGASTKRELLDGNEMDIGVNSVEYKLLDFIEDNSVQIDRTTWFTLDRLYFETGSSNLRAESREQLDRIAAILKAYPAVKLKLGGYTDDTGSFDVNMALSTHRAETAKTELVNRGIAANRLEAEGYGPEHPVCSANDTPECKAKNRRIDVRVTAK